MMFRVYHADREIVINSFFFRDEEEGGIYNLDSVQQAIKQGKYYHAGTINAVDLDDAYHESQNDIPPNYTSWGDGTQRSTSVGDILVDGYGTAWVVATVGFSLLGVANTARSDEREVPLTLVKVVTKV